MKIFKYILGVVALSILAYSCVSDSDNRLVRYTGNDLSGLTIYYGSKDGVQTVNIGGDTLNNIDSLRKVIVDKFLRDSLSMDVKRFEGGVVTYEFVDSRVTYVNRTNGAPIPQIISSYEFRNDSLFIDQKDGSNESQFFAGLGSSISDIHYHSGFACHYYYKDSITSKKDTIRVFKQKKLFLQNDTLTNQIMAQKFGFADDLSDMAPKDTIVWCNVKYRFDR